MVTKLRVTTGFLAAMALPTIGGFLLISCGGSPTSPLEVGQLSLGAAYDVYVSGGTAFVSNNEGIAILDIRDPHHPRRVTTIRESSGIGEVAGFHLSSDTLFAYGSQLTIFDVDDLADPRIVLQFSGRDLISVARKRGEHVYLTYLHGGLEVIDVQDPSHPVSVGYTDFSGQINDMVIHEGVVFIANSSTGLEVFDISDPTAPQGVGIVPGTSGAWDIHIDQELLFLGCHRYGVKILGLSEPSAPTVLGSFNNGGETYGVHVVGTRLYTADLQQGVEVLDISSPTQPSLTMEDGHYHPHDLYSDGQYLYLADQDRHFVVLPMELGQGG